MAPNPAFTVGENPTAAKLNTGVYRYDVSTTTVDVVSTTTETTVYTKALGAGHPSTDRQLRLTIEGDYLVNNGGVDGPTIRVKLGGVTQITSQVTNNAGAPRQGFVIEVTVSQRGLANSQWVRFLPQFANPNSGSVGNGLPVVAAGTVDTASAQTLEVTAQWGTNSANLSFRKTYAVLELVG